MDSLYWGLKLKSMPRIDVGQCTLGLICHVHLRKPKGSLHLLPVSHGFKNPLWDQEMPGILMPSDWDAWRQLCCRLGHVVHPSPAPISQVRGIKFPDPMIMFCYYNHFTSYATCICRNETKQCWHFLCFRGGDVAFTKWPLGGKLQTGSSSFSMLMKCQVHSACSWDTDLC